MGRIEEFYSELYDSDQAVTIQTDPEEVPPIMAWEVEAALRKMKNGKEAGKDQVNIETLKAGDETIAKQLAKLYTKCITERRIPNTWKEANMVIFFKKWNIKDIKNYRPIYVLSNMYKLFTKIITIRLEEKLDENQPRVQHRRSQDFCLGRGHPAAYATRPTPPSLASVAHTFEAAACSRGSMSAPAVSRVMGGAPKRNKNSKKI